MFVTLLVVSLILAAFLALVVLRFLRSSLRGILNRVVGTDSADHWYRFALFALYITSVGHGVEAYHLDRYIQKLHKDDFIATLSLDTWVYELYEVVERTLTALACGVVTIFIIALVCLVVLRIFEMRQSRTGSQL
jgi:hypothetical protein